MNFRNYIIVILLLMTVSCQTKVTPVSNPASWEVISRELMYKGSDNAIITEYIDGNRWIHTTTTSTKIRTLLQTLHTYTAQVTWIDAQGNRKTDPEVNLFSTESTKQFRHRQYEAMIGKKISPSLVSEILTLRRKRARAAYESSYCGRRALVVEYDIGNLSYYDMETGVLLARYRLGVPEIVLLTGRWQLRQDGKKGVYEINCRK